MSRMKLCSTILQATCVLSVLSLQVPVAAQSQPSLSREYIYVGGRVVAVENQGTSGGPGGGGPVRIDVWPGTASLGAAQTQQFVAKVTGTANTAVRWSISPNVGTITSAGLYTALPPVISGQSVTITAASEADLSKTSTATVSFYSPQVAGDYPLLGSFLNFYRNMPQSLWSKEFDWMRQISMNTIVVLSVGALRPDTADPLGYSLSGEGLLYPSLLVDASIRPTEDRLEMVLSLADQRGMKVYLGSLQTWADWTTGAEFVALREYNRRVAQEVLNRYGHHPSLEGWYFTQEIWMNWVKFYGSGYYGTALLRDFITDMQTLDATKPVCAAVVFKKDAYYSMPGLTPTDLQTVTTGFLATTQLPILMPQDGAGAEAGAAPLIELPSYFQALRNAAVGAGVGTVLWSAVETFTAVPNLSNDRYPPASAMRVQEQVNATRPYVTGYVNWIFGNDLSPQATYYPVEASGLNRDYQSRFRPSAVPQTTAFRFPFYQSVPGASPYYPDSALELANRTGGGYNGYTLTDWAGYRVEDTGGTVRVIADLGALQQLRSVRALSLSMNNSGIYHPRSMIVEVSTDGTNYSWVGNGASGMPETWDFSVGWTELSLATTARYVRCTFSHIAWLFLSELEVVGNPSAPPPPASVGISVDPLSVALTVGQTQQFTATVTGTTNTAVSWSLSPQLGTIGGTGLYTAPASVSTSQAVSVRAASQADPTKIASATVTINPDTTSITMVGPVSPNSGSGNPQLFRFDAQPRTGSLVWVQILFNSTVSPTNACLVYYAPDTDELFLSRDDSQPFYNTWTEPATLQVGDGPPTQPITPPSSLTNSQCTIDVTRSWVAKPAAGVQVNLSIQFATGWPGTKSIYMAAEDSGGDQVEWPYMGYWTVP